MKTLKKEKFLGMKGAKENALCWSTNKTGEVFSY